MRTLLLAMLLAMALGLAAGDASARGVDFANRGAEQNPFGRRADPTALPDVFGPGAVLRAGRVQMKVTNFGVLGNPFTATSPDPSGQWPGASGVEYLNFIAFAVGAIDRSERNPALQRRVSYASEWRPATRDPVDRIYSAYTGIANGARFVNDDGDLDPITHEPLIDEDFLDGRDNDGDGLIDEDYGVLGHQFYSWRMRDDTPEAIVSANDERHMPLGLECRQRAWAYAIPGYDSFIVVEYEVINRSGHTLDSLMLGWQVDMDAGPVTEAYWTDDISVPGYPQGILPIEIAEHLGLSEPDKLLDPPRRQHPHHPGANEPPGITNETVICPAIPIRINGFTTVDYDGDQGQTVGAGTFLLFDHTLDPFGISGTSRVGFTSFRSFLRERPYTQGGNPTLDAERWRFMISGENIGQDGFINAPSSEVPGDYSNWCSIGPWRNVRDGDRVSATIGFMVQEGSRVLLRDFPQDLTRFQRRQIGRSALLDKYPALKTAFAAHLIYEGMHEPREGFPRTNFHGRETPLRTRPGEAPYFAADCYDVEAGAQREVNDRGYTWFDFDCNYCTGVYDFPSRRGLFHHTWTGLPTSPQSPHLNTARDYNFTDNPHRSLVPAGDQAILLAWDNFSEILPDPDTQWFDFRGYRLWRAAGWTRANGSGGPGENDWTLIGEFRLFEYPKGRGTIPNNKFVNANGDTVCPKLLIPHYRNPSTGVIGPDSVEICLEVGDLWDKQTGVIIRPETALRCLGDYVDPYEDADGNGFPDSCQVVQGCLLHSPTCGDINSIEHRTLYPIGRYRFVDRTVRNGFTYFYSVTAFDSTTRLGITTELGSRRQAIEAEGVEPQASSRTDKGVWVVPNPYRGYRRIAERPSNWDLAPSPSDPTGTHIDFMGLPRGRWTIRIYTVAGDLVAELHWNDAINASIRPPVEDPLDPNVARSGVTRQQDSPNDGQARWNLLSRNGQDVVSGIYVFTVESDQGTQRGKFVIIR